MIVVILSMVIAWALLAWVAIGLNYAYLTVHYSGFRSLPLRYAPLLLIAGIVLGSFAHKVIEPILDRHFPYT